jgi:hypothetical protein
VPVLAGSGLMNSAEDAVAAADKIGYPVLLKVCVRVYVYAGVVALLAAVYCSYRHVARSMEQQHSAAEVGNHSSSSG